jgi:hypothetical protein
MTSPFYNNINITNNNTMIALKEPNTTSLVEILNYDDNQVSYILEEIGDKVRVTRYRHTEDRGLEAEYFIKDMTSDMLVDTLIRNKIVSADEDLLFALEEDIDTFLLNMAFSS